MIIVFARGTTASPTAPTAGGTVPTWSAMQSAFANALGIRSAYCIATASNHTSGVWTNATHICVIVLRPDAGKVLAYGGSAAGAGNTTQTIIYPALTFTAINGTSWSVRCGSRTVADSEIGTSVPAGYTNQIIQPAGASALMAVHTREGIAANPTADTVTTAGTNATYRAHTVEVTEATPFPSATIVDDFNRANQYPPGSSWLGSFNVDGMRVVSNQLVNPSDGWDGVYWNATPVADMEAYVTVGTLGAAGKIFQIQLRRDHAADTSYIFSFFKGSPDGVEVYRRIAGSDVLIASNYALTFAAGDKFGASVLGNAIKIWHKSGAGAWTAVASAINSEITAAGVVALFTNGATWVVDDFGGPAVSGGTALTLDLTDSVALAESPTQAQGMADTFTDTAALTDSAGLVADFASTLSDSVSLSDTPSLVADYTLAPVDSVTLGDVAIPEILGDLSIPLTDSVTLSDSASMQANSVFTLTDSVTLGDSFTGNVMAPSGPSYMDSNSIVGTFVVGDGTRVGETPVFYPAKPQLILTGKQFDVNVFAGDFIVAPIPFKPKLTLAGKTVTHVGDSTVLTGKSRLVLAGKAFTTIVPVVLVPGKPSLVLKSKAFVLSLNSSPVVGKPVLVLRGKAYEGHELALLASVPIDIDLIPSLAESLVLTPTSEQNLLLVPTVEEFR